MTLVVLGLLALAIAWVVRRQRARRDDPIPPSGALAGLVDQGRDLLAPLYPSRPLSRRALPRRLLRAAEQTITIGVSGTVLVPTHIEIVVNPADLEPFADAMEWLRRDVAEALRQRAAANGWVVPSGPDVAIVADDERPVRLPRATGRLHAFRSEDVRTRGRTGPAPEAVKDPDGGSAPTPRPEQTAATSIVWEGLDLPTVPAGPAAHLRLVAVGEPATDGDGDLNALLVAVDPPLVVGRSREAGLQVRNRQVSARHCTLRFDAERGSVVVKDLGSTNGTYVDGHRVGEAPLTAGAVLRLGGSSWQVDVETIA